MNMCPPNYRSSAAPVVKAECKDISHEVQLDMPMSICKAFSCNVIVFLFIQKERLEKQNVTKTRTQKGGVSTIKRFKALVLNVIHSIKQRPRKIDN